MGAAANDRRIAAGVGLALASALSFGAAGSFASALFETGWTPGTAALVRSAIGTVIALPFGLAALGGRWRLIRANLVAIVAFGVFGVSGAQFCYFMAVERMDVGPALLVEYTSPIGVVAWLWLRHGQRPGPVTLLGAVLAGVGLVLVLRLVGGGAEVNAAGVAWSLLAMIGAVVYFVIIADHSSGLPPLTLAAGGLLAGTVLLGILIAGGVLPSGASTADVVLAGKNASWWVPVVLLGVMTSGVAYLTGTGAGRLLGARLAAFVALFEVVAGVGYAWIFVAQTPAVIQAVGGLLVLAGVVAVKLGEQQVADPLDVLS